MAEFQIVVFSLNNQLCGVETSQVKEIIKYQDVSKVPELPEYVEGIINLRKNVIPIINLNKRFDLGNSEITDNSKIIITKVDDYFIGFIVNDVSEIIKLTEDEMEAAPKIIYNNTNTYLKSIGKRDNKLISILDMNNILADSEVKNLVNV